MSCGIAHTRRWQRTYRYPPHCQNCGAVLDPPTKPFCDNCGSSDYDEGPPTPRAVPEPHKKG